MFKRMNAGGGSGGGGGGRGRRAGGGAKAKSSGPAGAWKGLIQSSVLMCEIAARVVENSDGGDEAMQQADQLKTLLKVKTFQHGEKLDVLHAVAGLVENFLPIITDANNETVKELDADQLLDAVYSSCLGVLGETLEGAGGDEASESKSQQECEFQAAYSLKVLEASVNASLQESLAQVELARSKFRAHVTPLVKILQEVSASATRSEFIREAATAVLGQLIELWPKAIEEEKLVEGVIDICFKLCADHSDESLNPNEFSAQNLGTQTLDALATHIKPTSLVAELTIARAKTASASTDKFQRKSALVNLAVLPEAGKEYFSQHVDVFNDIFGLLYTALKDSEALVRGAAFIAMSEFLEHGPAAATKAQHDRALAEIIRTLHNASEPKLTRMKSGIPLMYLAEHLDAAKLEEKDQNNNVAQIILQQIKLTRASASGSSEDGDLLDSLLNSLRSLFEKHKEPFRPFFVAAVDTLVPLLNETEDPWIAARGPSILALAALAETYGADAFRPHLKALTQSLVSGYTIVNVPLRTAIHAAWSTLFDVFRDDAELTSHLSAIVTAICSAFQEDYPATIAQQKKADAKAKAKQNGGGDDDEDEEDEENEEGDEGEEGEDQMEEDEEIDGERKAAIDSFISMTEVLGTKFLPHHQRIFELLCADAPYSDEVKQAIANAILYITQVYPPSDSGAPPSKETAEVLKQARHTLFTFVQLGMTSALAEQALQTMETLLKAYKSAFYENKPDLLKAIIKTCKRALSQKLLCQVLANNGETIGDEDGEEDADDDDEQQADGDDEDEVEVKDFFGGKKKKKHAEKDDDEEEENGEEQSKPNDKLAVAGKSTEANSQTATTSSVSTTGSATASASASASCSVGCTAHGHAHGNAGVESDGKTAHEECPPIQTAALDVLVACMRAAPSADTFNDAYALMKPTLVDKTYFGYGLGSVGELIDAVQDGAAALLEPIADQLFDAIFKAADDANEPFSIRCVSYTIGVIFLRAGNGSAAGNVKVKSQLNKSLSALQTALQKTKTALQDSNLDESESEHWLAAQDNAASAVGKIIIANGEDFEVKTVLTHFLAALPIKSDALEVNPAYTATVNLVQKHANVLQEHLGELTRIFVSVLSDSAIGVNDKLKNFVSTAAKQLLAIPDPNKAIDAALAAAGETNAKKFRECVDSKN